MSETPKLLPCPFCDSDASYGTSHYGAATIKEQGWESGDRHFVSCPWCGVSNGARTGFATQAEAAAWWNKRGQHAPSFTRAESALAARHERLRSAVALALPALRRCAMHLQGRPQFREDENILSYRIGELRDALEADR